MRRTVAMVLTFALGVASLGAGDASAGRGGKRTGGRWTSAGGVVVDGQGRVVLVKTKKDRRWTLPKGRVEGKDTLRRAAEREVREEAGLEAKAGVELVRHVGRLHDTVYFLMEVLDETYLPHDGEIVKVRALKAYKAMKRLSTKRDRGVLGRYIRYVLTGAIDATTFAAGEE